MKTDHLISVNEIADEFNDKPRNVARWIKKNDIRHTQIDHPTRLGSKVIAISEEDYKIVSNSH